MRKFESKDYEDVCPDHGTEALKEYDFGAGDATIFTHDGCKCCVLITRDLMGFAHGKAAIGTYDELHGIARLQSAMNSSKCR